MRPFAIVSFVILAAILAGCGSDPAPSSASRYLALGDSNTSGAGLPTPATGAPENCFRTESGYPSFAAKELDQDEFESVACSGAGMNAFVSDMELYPDGDAPPQFNALKGNETIVSVTIGDNDAGFGEVTETCLKATSPSDTPCQDKYVTSDGNKMTEAAEALAKPLGEKLDAIHDRAPKAKIFVVGYGPIIPKDGAGCWGKVNVSESDAPYFYGWQNSITETEKATAKAHGATYVDFFNAGKGHDACQSPAKRWTNPVNDVGSAGWPLHPTLAGSKAAATELVKLASSSRLGS
jgi:lysophospholipase L1-like esterase